MKINSTRILSLFIALIMIAGVLSSCQGLFGDTETESSSSSESFSESGSSSGSEDSSNNQESSSTESGDESEESSTTPDDDYVEETYPSLLEGENAEFIEYADHVANGVNSYFTDPNRTAFYFENKNACVTYDLEDSKVVSSIGNKAGANYVENTMDVFLRMKDGSVYYASDSDKNTYANIYKLGYYYYENRFEGLTFDSGYVFEDKKPARINHAPTNILRYNMTEFVEIESGTGGVKIKVTDNGDPWIAYKTVNFSASEYNVLAITMKADEQSTTSLVVYIKAGVSTGFSNEQSIGVEIIPDGEYHTYYVPLYEISGYTGQVTGLRFDFATVSGAIDTTYAISDVRAMKADLDATPTMGVYLNRMFNTYSDKLHHTIQISTKKDVENVQAVGIVTEIPESRVGSIVIKDRNGLHYDLEKIAWNTVQYVGFDIKGAGIYGYILPYDGSGGVIRVTLDDGVYKIEQTKAPDAYTLQASPEGTKNGKDLYMGHRIYTDRYHTFDRFIVEAELEVNPLDEENFIIDGEKSTYGEFIGYDALRGCYTLSIDGEGGFSRPYKLYPNRHYNVTFNIKGDGANDRKIYVVALFEGGGFLECAALLDKNQMMLPVPLEVGKNYSDLGDRNLFNLDDPWLSETLLPMVVNKDTDNTYSIVNLYYNWGKYPLKQISWIQYHTPYYHLSTGVHESNCITPFYTTSQDKAFMQVLPDHRPMSGPTWENDVQRTYCGVHSFLQYTDSDGNYFASENILNTVGSYGPIYADLTTDYISDDGKIKVTYNHMEMPQTDENRTYYQMKYEVLEDVSFTDFGRDFSFYSVKSIDYSGLYSKVGYLDTNNTSQVANAAKENQSFEYVLGDNCPYFSFFAMENCTHPNGYNNLSFLIYNSEFTIGGEKVTPSFLLVNNFAEVSLSLDLEAIELKKGDTFTINAILMPWQWYEEYDAEEPDQNVRRVRENSLLNPLTLTAGENCEKIESVFLPKAKTTNGKSAEFTLSGGHNNVAVRIYGFHKLTAPVIEEYVDGEWKLVDISSFSTPDNFGYGHYYDGYGVYYDGDGTYSYSFVTTMDNGAPRKFRVSAAEDFEGWPEIIKEPDPFNTWYDIFDLNGAFAEAANRFGDYSLMSGSGSNFLRVTRNGTTAETTLTLFDNAEGMLAGRYLIFKFRLPQGKNSNINFVEFYTGTEHTMYNELGEILIAKEAYTAANNSFADGEWHVVVLDLEAYGKTDSFKKNEDGKYYIQYLRFDVFNGGGNPNAVIDMAYLGFHDSLDEILEYNKDVNTVMLFSGSSFENISTLNNEALNMHVDASELDAILVPYKSRFHSVTLSEERDYIRLTGSVGAEAIAEVFNGNVKETGQYLVLKYRIPEDNPGKLRYWQLYINTDGKGASSENVYVSEGLGNHVVADGEWQVLIIDLAARGNPTYVMDENGKYTAKFFRFDFFKAQYDETVFYDIAYIAFSNNLDDIYELENDMSKVALSTGRTECTFIDPKTGNEITAE